MDPTNISRTLYCVFVDIGLSEKLKKNENMKCFCGYTIRCNQFKSHVVVTHQSLLPTKTVANKYFDQLTSKCCYCEFYEKDEVLKRYHLYADHKDKIRENVTETGTIINTGKYDSFL